MSKVQSPKLDPRYMTDSKGKRMAVVLSIEEYEALVEFVEDYLDARELDKAEASSRGFMDGLEVLNLLDKEK